MSVVINTERLKNALSKAVNGAGNNKLIPITGLMRVKVVGDTLSLVTTDMTSFVYVPIKGVVGDDFTVVIEAEKFSKLIGKMTCENVTLELTESAFEVFGNGKYKIEIPLDENGNRIEYPEPEVTPGEKVEISKPLIDLVLSTCKPALATTLEVPVYTNYYIGESVLATDTYKIASIAKEVFPNKQVLISSELMDLIALSDSANITVIFCADNKICFKAEDITVMSKLESGVEEYAVDAICDLVNYEFDSKCKFRKSDMLSALDRIAIFVGKYDNRAIRMTFTNDGIKIESKQSNGIETVIYEGSGNFTPFTCMINIDMLIQQIKANPNDVIEIHYGDDNSVKLVDGAFTQVIALLED